MAEDLEEKNRSYCFTEGYNIRYSMYIGMASALQHRLSSKQKITFSKKRTKTAAGSVCDLSTHLHAAQPVYVLFAFYLKFPPVYIRRKHSVPMPSGETSSVVTDYEAEIHIANTAR